MRTESKVRRLERRVETLEREVAQLRRSEEADLERARSLLFEHLKTHEDVEPLVFAARNDLPNDIVEKVLEEFDKKRWTVPVED